MAKIMFLMRLMSLTSMLLMSCVMCEYGTYVLIPTRKTIGIVMMMAFAYIVMMMAFAEVRMRRAR